MLSSFIDMLLCGPFAKRNPNFDHDGRTYVALSIALLMYNAIKKTPPKPATNTQHKVDRETPIAIYIALKMYSATEHCEETLNQLHKLSICLSYARVSDISKEMQILLLKCFRGEV